MSRQLVPYWAKALTDKNGRTWIINSDSSADPLEPFEDGSEESQALDFVLDNYGPVTFLKAAW